jgi:hypothetical protein
MRCVRLSLRASRCRIGYFMSRMIDLIRTSSVPANLMQAAARGALSVPAPEMIEILVHLANHNKIFSQQARMTLAGWDEKSSLAAASDPATPPEVLEYLINPENLRPHLLPALLENLSVPVETLITLAASGTKEIADALHNSPRAQRVPEVLSALASNSNIPATETAAIHHQLAATGFEDAIHEADEPLAAYLTEHSAALASEGEKPFNPIGGMYMEDLPAGATAASPAPTSQEAEPQEAEPSPTQAVAVQAATPAQAATQAPPTATAHAASPSAAAAKPALKAKKPTPADEDRGSALQKIARLDIKGRIKLAMKGDKEMRSILVRDGTKLVALAVLESPKITDGEVEKIAAQKNVLEAVLRQIPMKRRFMKNYIVVRNLVANPRTPLDVSLGLMKNIMVNDLRNLASNKDVPETVRKLAFKMFKQKSEPQKKSTG